MEEHNIGWAVAQLNSGRKIRRAGWNGKGMWLQLQRPDEHSKMTLPYVYIEYPVGHPAYPNGSRVPLLASLTDLLATDWEIAEYRATVNSDDRYIRCGRSVDRTSTQASPDKWPGMVLGAVGSNPACLYHGAFIDA